MRLLAALLLLCVSVLAADPAQLIRDLASPSPGVRRNAAEGAKTVPTTPALTDALLGAAKNFPGIDGTPSGSAQESVFAALAQHGKDDARTVAFFFRTEVQSQAFDAEGITERSFQTASDFWHASSPTMKTYLRGMIGGGEANDALTALQLMADLEQSDFPRVDALVRNQLIGTEKPDLGMDSPFSNLYLSLARVASRYGYRNAEAFAFAAKQLSDPKNYTVANRATLFSILSGASELGRGDAQTLKLLKTAEALSLTSPIADLVLKIRDEIAYQNTGKFNPTPDKETQPVELLKKLRHNARYGPLPLAREAKVYAFNPDHIRNTLLKVPEEQRLSELRKTIRAMMKSGDSDIRLSAMKIVEELYLDGPKGWKELLGQSRTCLKILNILRKHKRID